ncbi:MAG: methyltransferase family protein [Bacteroidetes bacterium]|jgi:2-polyprenyl-3-methyl-5-hydroxy-6-metoxy-1,4-benzoquinol methylase|nr:methyltransferase family protein [Bacteroidota bacterium]
MTTSVEEVKSFYDKDTTAKYKIRNNLRHFLLILKLKQLGIRQAKNCLEIGCGNGGVTRLIAKSMSGNILGIDISEKTVEAAKENLVGYKNVKLQAVDLLHLDTKETYDFIVLLDVLEHIPFEQHNELFKKMSALLSNDGIIFINIPEPTFNEWCSKTSPDKQQIIDLAVHSDRLISICYQNGLYLRELTGYKIFHNENDYQQIVLAKAGRNIVYKRNPTSVTIRKKLVARILNMLS